MSLNFHSLIQEVPGPLPIQVPGMIFVGQVVWAGLAHCYLNLLLKLIAVLTLFGLIPAQQPAFSLFIYHFHQQAIKPKYWW